MYPNVSLDLNPLGYCDAKGERLASLSSLVKGSTVYIERGGKLLALTVTSVNPFAVTSDKPKA
jgi:hypothetical protein